MITVISKIYSPRFVHRLVTLKVVEIIDFRKKFLKGMVDHAFNMTSYKYLSRACL